MRVTSAPVKDHLSKHLFHECTTVIMLLLNNNHLSVLLFFFLMINFNEYLFLIINFVITIML